MQVILQGGAKESFGVSLVASEIMCRAKGDDVCRFIMAHPSKIAGYIKDYLEKDPGLAKKIINYEIPGFFKRKEMEEELRRAHDELETRVKERTAELTAANAQLKLEMENRKKAEEVLRESEERYRRITGAVPDYLFTVRIEDGHPVETIHGPACVAVTGYTSEEYAPDPNLWIRLVPEEDRGIVLEQVNRILSGQDTHPIEHRILRKDGIIRWVSNTLVPHYDTQGRLLSYDGLIRDITERRQAEESLKSSETRLHTLIENTADGIAVTDRNRIVRFVNPAAEALFDRKKEELTGELFGFPVVTGETTEMEIIRKDRKITVAEMRVVEIEWEGENAHLISIRDITEHKVAEDTLKKRKASLIEAQRIAHLGNWEWDIEKNEFYWSDELYGIFGLSPQEFGASYEAFLNAVHPDDREFVKQSVNDALSGERPCSIDYRIVLPDGTTRILHEQGEVTYDKHGKPIRMVGTVQDITERKQMEERINYLAYYDDLTGIPNRTLFVDRLNQGISRNVHIKRFSAVLSVDIDRFKLINDTLGFDAGDAVLKEVAERLKISTRDGDTVARLGSDDFGIILNYVAHSEDVIRIVEKVMKNVSQPINFKGKEIVLTLGVGVAVYPNDGNDSYTLMKNADLALSKAKQQGRKNYQFFTEDMDVKALEFVRMEKHLFNALQNEEYILHYQPYWDTTTKKMAGMEALIRWQSKDKGLVPPGNFIPVLEDTGMIIEVGEWILREAMRQVKEWQDKGYPVVPISVNMSLVQFRQKDLAEMVKRIMRERGFYPSLLTLEITESAFMQDIEFTRSVLTTMKEIGCSVSIDDFGTGYSSLAYLKRFPVDNLKIDISFIRDIVTDPDTASIVTAIIAMARTLNLKTIAEGVETEEQWKILRFLRCDMCQGYYFSKPLPAEDVEKLLIYQKIT